MMVIPIDESTFWVDAPGFISGKVRIHLHVACGNVKDGIAIESIQLGGDDGHYSGGAISVEDLKEIIRLSDSRAD